jgi:curved DNA-binding protein CbpA
VHRPAEITFYDELGVAATATPEEIRDSFRALVKILHPDHQTDPQLKEIAERQMRKLNGVYTVLSDPEKRRRYDESLEDEDFRPAIILSPNSNVNVHRLMERMAWVAALIVAAVTLIWLSSESPAPSPQSSEQGGRKSYAPAAPAPAGASAAEVAELRSDVRVLKLERDAAIHEVNRLRSSGRASAPARPEPFLEPATSLPSAVAALPPQLPPAAPVPGPASASVVPVRVPAQHPPSSAVRPFAGFWFYARPASSQHGKTSTLYPPEFIEATITEQNGLVKGKYRSRYKIVDRAISPDVSFEFGGMVSGSTVVCPWAGTGGAKGELTLKMVGENSLTVDWTVTELGSIQGLIRGTATLTRQLD